MKVLYIGYYKENSDWGRFTTNNILALDAAGVDVTCRSIELGQGREVAGRLAELEQKTIEDCDVCIQHVFPDHMVGSTIFNKNIGLISNDFVEMGHTTWIEKIEQLDEAWVTNIDSQRSLALDFKGEKIVRVAPFSCITDNYKKRHKDIQFEPTLGTCKFYTICNGPSAGLESIVSSFYSEFDVSENASLTIFVGSDDPQVSKQIDEMSRAIKIGLRLQPQPEMFARDTLVPLGKATETDLYSVHQYGDCFVSCSHGDSWPMQAFDAMAFGKQPIISNFGGAKEFIENGTGHLIDFAFSVCKANTQITEQKNGKDYNILPCERSMKGAMREFYDKWTSNPVQYSNESKVAGLSAAQKFSLEQTGEKMKEFLNA